MQSILSRRTLAMALFLLPIVAMGQAWTLEPGTTVVRAGVGFASADTWHDHEGEQQPLDPRLTDASSPFRDRSVRLAAEYGLLEDLTIVGGLGLRSVRLLDGVEDPAIERSTTDLSEAHLGFRLGLGERVGLGDRHALGVNLQAHLPLGHHRNIVPAVGGGQIDFDLVASYGYSFDPIAATAELNVGYRFRSRMFGLSRMQSCPVGDLEEGEPLCLMDLPEYHYSDELLAHAEVGYTALDRILLRVLLGTVWSIERPEVAEMPTGLIHPPAFTQRRHVFAGAGASVLMFGGTSFFVQASTSVYARNTISAPWVSIGIETRL